MGVASVEIIFSSLRQISVKNWTAVFTEARSSLTEGAQLCNNDVVRSLIYSNIPYFHKTILSVK